MSTKVTKRKPAPSSPADSPKKKAKKDRDDDQPQLESFFRSPAVSPTKKKVKPLATEAKKDARGKGKEPQPEDIICLSDEDDVPSASTKPLRIPDQGEISAGSPAKQTRQSQIEEDEAFAREMARKDGIDVEALRRQEESDAEMARSIVEGEGKYRKVKRRENEHAKSNENGKGGQRGTLKTDVEEGLKTEDVKVEDVLNTVPVMSSPKQTRKTKPMAIKAEASPPSSALIKPSKTFDTFSDSIDYSQLLVDIFDFTPLSIPTSSWPLKNKANPSQRSIPYSFLTAAFVQISATRSRLLISKILTNTLRTVMYYSPDTLLEAIYLITNHVAPAYEGIELGIGSQVLSKAIKAVSGVGAKEMKQLWDIHGDSGDVAFAAKCKVKTLFPTPPLLISQVYQTLVKISSLKGQGVVNQKADLVQKLLVNAKGEEVRYLVRTFVSHLRIGAVKLTVTSALARSFCLAKGDGETDHSKGADRYGIGKLERKGILAIPAKAKDKDDPRRLELMARLAKAEKLVREVYVRHPNYSHIVPALLEHGLPGLSDAVPLSVGTPLSPMLGQITRDLADVRDRLEESRSFVAEWKYDGQRVQIHARRRREGEEPKDDINPSGRGGKWVGEDKMTYVRLFSRHLEDMTDKYPDILALIPMLLSGSEVAEGSSPNQHRESFIMDAEICAIAPETGALLTFQTLANRARKDVQIGNVKVRVGIFVFDLMYLNGKSLLTESFRARRRLLKTHFPPLSPTNAAIARFDHVAALESNTNDLDCVREFMNEAIKSSCEGIMIKVLDHLEGEDPAVKAEGAEVDLDEDTAEEDFNGEGKEADEDAESDELQGGIEKGRSGRKKARLASYEPDKRGESWLKCKKDYGDLHDSLDLIPIGAWHGMGRKAGWWSPILLALYNPDTGGYDALCKCISGFTDQFYKDLNVRYTEGTDTCSKQSLAYVETGSMIPDVWFLPSEVWEIRGADITISPVYPAARGLIHQERGLSLRFPRFIKVREDKALENATTPEELASAYRVQSEGQVKAATAKIEAVGTGGDACLMDEAGVD